MFYPALSKKSSGVVNIPTMSGGVNLADPLTLVDDNQATDMSNMWYKGYLQTRPAIRDSGDVFCQCETNDWKSESIDTQCDYYYLGIKYRLIVRKTYYGSGIYTYCKITISAVNEFGVLFTTEPLEMVHTYYDESELHETRVEACNAVVYTATPTKSSGLGIYIIAAGPFTTDTEGLWDSGLYIYELCCDNPLSSTINFVKLENNEIYAPTILINGKGDKFSELPVATDADYAPASTFEGYSLISNAWSKYYFTTDGSSTLFALPSDIYDIDAIKITLTMSSKTEKFEWRTTDGNGMTGMIVDRIEEGEYGASYENGVVTIKASEDVAPPDMLGKITNNLCIEILKHRDSAYGNIMRNVSFGTWFGGSADGINGGTRLFVAGATGKNKNIMLWSDINEPTYFSENNYAYVGDANSGITALKKQSNMLVIFKENEIFYTVYSAGNSYSAEDVVAGRILDVTTVAATFPIVHIHDRIGCKNPETIQLCGDRLVWFTEGKVYMLQNANQYSTANVAPISQMIESDFESREPTVASSATFDGYYLLIIGNKIYALNFDYYYFKNLPAYSDSAKAQRKLTWFIWTLPKANEESISVNSANIISLNNCAILLDVSEGYTASYKLLRFTDESDADLDINGNERRIESMFQTKMFDFGSTDRFKKIEQLYIGIGEESGETTIEYVTERGRTPGTNVSIVSTGDKRSSEFIKMHRFLPGVMRALNFGFRMECEGRIAVSGIVIKYKPMGVIR